MLTNYTNAPQRIRIIGAASASGKLTRATDRQRSDPLKALKHRDLRREHRDLRREFAILHALERNYPIAMNRL